MVAEVDIENELGKKMAALAAIEEIGIAIVDPNPGQSMVKRYKYKSKNDMVQWVQEVLENKVKPWTKSEATPKNSNPGLIFALNSDSFE